MQKFYSIFPKGKRRQLNFYSPCDAFLSDHINQKNIFKHYQFDSDCLGATNLDRSIMSNSKTNESDKSQISDVPTSELFSDTENNLKLLEYCSTSNLTDSCSIVSLQSFSPKEEKKYPSEGKTKSRRNMYVINISNSKYFHIGPQKTISINENQLSKDTLQPCVGGNYSSQFKVNFKKLLDCEQKLTEECITLISLHLHDQWKEFVKYLELENNTLGTLELRNDNDRVLIVYDALQELMNLFPNTSLGFIINALNEIHQMSLIERLAQELDIMFFDVKHKEKPSAHSNPKIKLHLENLMFGNQVHPNVSFLSIMRTQSSLL